VNDATLCYLWDVWELFHISETVEPTNFKLVTSNLANGMITGSSIDKMKIKSKGSRDPVLKCLTTLYVLGVVQAREVKFETQTIRNW